MTFAFMDKYPYVLCKEITELSDLERLNISKHAVEQYNSKFNVKERNGYNVKLERIPELQKLWDIFEEYCIREFSNVAILKTDRYRDCWAYIQNSDQGFSVWHTHVFTATINAVYYANLPDKSATLSIINNDGEEKEVFIKENYLYLFPGWMLHKPNEQKMSKKPRISINLELLTLTRPIHDSTNIMW
jgi:hypothetical protein